MKVLGLDLASDTIQLAPVEISILSWNVNNDECNGNGEMPRPRQSTLPTRRQFGCFKNQIFIGTGLQLTEKGEFDWLIWSIERTLDERRKNEYEAHKSKLTKRSQIKLGVVTAIHSIKFEIEWWTCFRVKQYLRHHRKCVVPKVKCVEMVLVWIHLR